MKEPDNTTYTKNWIVTGAWHCEYSVFSYVRFFVNATNLSFFQNIKNDISV